MGRQEAAAQYGAALKQGRKTYHDCVLRGRYPYPQVLDEIISEAMVAGEMDLGVVEIPIDQIKGTKTAGRRTAFAADFMPLLEPDTEFAGKWMDLCQAHLGDEGIRDPVRCFEYLGRFYVQEGNKRVSVLRSYGAPVIPGYVTRMVPVWSEAPEIQAYYDFMESYPKTRLYRVRFSRAGSFQKLQKALGYEPDHVWSDDERRRFTAGYTYFQEPFRKLGGGELPITTADAMLVWLKVYGFDELLSLPAAELAKSIKAVWADVKALTEPIDVKTDAPEAKDGGLLGRLFKGKPSHINVAFVSDQLPEQSDWARAHDLGRQYLEAVLGDRVSTQVFNGVRPGGDAEAAMEEAIANGAQLIFAVTPPLIGACRKTAAQHPDVRILHALRRGADLLQPDLRGKVYRRSHCRRAQPGGADRLCGLQSHLRCAGQHQRLCPGSSADQSGGADHSALVLCGGGRHGGSRPAGGFPDLQPGYSHAGPDPGTLGPLPGGRRKIPLPGLSLLALGQCLYQSGPQCAGRRLGRPGSPGKPGGELLVGHEQPGH